MSADCAFVDPHMHLWDLKEHADTHDRRLLSGVREQALSLHYKEEIEVHRSVQQVVVVEALPLLPLKEIDLFSTDSMVGAFVAACDLSKDSSTLPDIVSRSPKVRGVRQILNWDAAAAHRTWPNLSSDLTLDHSWWQGFGQLNSLGLSFDLQANPSQLISFASAYSQVPDAPVVIIDHMGTPQLDGAQDKQTYDQWLQGMQALSRFPRIFCKLSMLTHVIHGASPGWWHDKAECGEITRKMIREVIDMFGAERCMWASNWPVDAATFPPGEMIAFFDEMSRDLSIRDRTNLWSGSAIRAYRMKL